MEGIWYFHGEMVMDKFFFWFFLDILITTRRTHDLADADRWGIDDFVVLWDLLGNMQNGQVMCFLMWMRDVFHGGFQLMGPQNDFIIENPMKPAANQSLWFLDIHGYPLKTIGDPRSFESPIDEWDYST